MDPAEGKLQLKKTDWEKVEALALCANAFMSFVTVVVTIFGLIFVVQSIAAMEGQTQAMVEQTRAMNEQMKQAVAQQQETIKQTIALTKQAEAVAEQAKATAEQQRVMAKQTEVLAKQTAASVSASTMTQIKIISDNFRRAPQIYPYFFNGAVIDYREDMPKEEKELYWLVQIACEDYLDVFDMLIKDQEQLILKDGEQLIHFFPQDPGWEVWMVDTFKNSPMLCKFFTEHRWYLETAKNGNGEHMLNKRLAEYIQRGERLRILAQEAAAERTGAND